MTQTSRSDVGERPVRLAPCECGSGLAHKHCCGLAVLVLPRPQEVSALEPRYRELTACLARGDAAGAERGCLAILTQAPGHVRALKALAQLRKAQGEERALEVLLGRLFALHPNDDWTACELAMLAYQRKDLNEAHKHARDAVRLSPTNPQAHNLMGMILTDQHQLHPAEYHYRKALELHPPVGKLCANLGLNLKQQGKVEEAEEFYRQAMELEPDNAESLLGWVRLEEVRRNLDEAEALLGRAEGIDAAHPGLPMTRSILHRRQKRYAEALAALEQAPTEGKSPQALVGYSYERGEILDQMGRYDEAFEAFAAANAAIVDTGIRPYGKEAATALAQALTRFFNRRIAELLPRASPPEGGRARPIFIVGFPRSGTTMVEQILSSHPAVEAGDELHFIWDLTRVGQQMVASDLPYPDFLADLWLGTNQGALDNFRDYYLKRAQQIGVSRAGVPWFTDKMPLNETHLGLIHLVFPDSPIVHLIRHPLDVVLSCFFNDLTHGNNCAYALETAAYHYALTRELVDHYLRNLDLRYLAVRYEDIVADIEPNARQLLEFIGEPWDERCLAFHENRRYARTASYSQVTERLYSRSVYRYKNYRKHLEPIVPILEPAIRALGYDIE